MESQVGKIQTLAEWNYKVKKGQYLIFWIRKIQIHSSLWQLQQKSAVDMDYNLSTEAYFFLVVIEEA